MKTIAAILALICVISVAPAQQSVPMTPLVPAGQAATPKPSEQKRAPIYDESADVKQLIADALVRAKKDNRRVLIQWGGNWCGWCIRLHGLYKSDKDIAKELLYEYEVVFADAGQPMGKNIDLAKQYSAELEKHGFPYLTILDGDGKVLANQDTASLEIKGATAAPWHDPKLVLEFLKKYEAPHLEAQLLLDRGLAEASQSGRVVFLHFGAPWCGWCKRLEAWMEQKSVKPLLAKAFVEVKIDTERNIGGDDLLKRFASERAGGIPWFAFLDSQGNVIATSNGPKGNIGFPAHEDEIAHFKVMLEAIGGKLSATDIEAIIATLGTK